VVHEFVILGRVLLLIACGSGRHCDLGLLSQVFQHSTVEIDLAFASIMNKPTEKMAMPSFSRIWRTIGILLVVDDDDE
jgi:hypothetical protein